MAIVKYFLLLLCIYELAHGDNFDNYGFGFIGIQTPYVRSSLPEDIKPGQRSYDLSIINLCEDGIYANEVMGVQVFTRDDDAPPTVKVLSYEMAQINRTGQLHGIGKVGYMAYCKNQYKGKYNS